MKRLLAPMFAVALIAAVACDDEGGTTGDGAAGAAGKSDGGAAGAAGKTDGGAAGAAGTTTDGAAGAAGTTGDGAAGAGGTKTDGGSPDGAAAGSGGTDGGADATVAAVNWSTCEAPVVTPPSDGKPGIISASDFCAYYDSKCGATFYSEAAGHFKDKADCLAKYPTYGAKQSCASYHLCVAGTPGMAAAHCLHPAAGGGNPCGL